MVQNRTRTFVQVTYTNGAAFFAPGGNTVGFDGSPLDGRIVWVEGRDD